MTHVISDLLFSNENYAQKATSTVQACFIKKTDKRARISKIQSKFFLAHWYAFKLPDKTTLRNFPNGGSISFFIELDRKAFSNDLNSVVSCQERPFLELEMNWMGLGV